MQMLSPLQKNTTPQLELKIKQFDILSLRQIMRLYLHFLKKINLPLHSILRLLTITPRISQS